MDFTLYNKTLKAYLIDALNWLIPPHCHACLKANDNLKANGDDSAFCTACEQSLPIISQACLQCGTSIPKAQPHCGRCLITPPIYDACFCPFEYAAPISQLICRFKYGSGQPHLAGVLAELIATHGLRDLDPRPEVLIPVPCHPNKLRQRGFNQAHQLAKHLAKVLKIPVDASLIHKHKATPPQASKALNQRKSNIKNSFSMQKRSPYKHVAIIDDVITSGATMEEIAKILKKNGVDYIQAWGVARVQ